MTWWAWLLVTWSAALVAVVGFFYLIGHHRERYGPTTVTAPGASFVPSDEGKLLRVGHDEAMEIQRVVSPTVVVVVKPRKR